MQQGRARMHKPRRLDAGLMKWAAAAALLMAAAGCKSESNERAQSVASTQTEARVQALVDKTKSQMVFVQGGGFWLGDFGELMDDRAKKNNTPPGPNAKPGDNLPFSIAEDNKPPKWVTLDGFHMQKFKVTYDDFDVYVAANGLPPHPPQGDETFQRVWQDARTSGNIPAGVNWHQAKGYCQWLGKVTGLPFDLPTEAQWEYAASNRTNSYRHPYPTDTGLLREGQTHPGFEQKQKLIGDGMLYPVGLFAPNGLGLHDLVGNGFDWVNDWYAADAYQSGPVHNPTGPASGSEKVLRGKPPSEDWIDGFPHLDRYHHHPDVRRSKSGKVYAFVEQGFRCVVNKSTLLTEKP